VSGEYGTKREGAAPAKLKVAARLQLAMHSETITSTSTVLSD
jgi:hypothetical protein